MRARHTVLSILFATWIVSHLDRMAMSVALPYIAADFHLSPLESGFLMSIFFAGYALSHIPGGLLADRFGVRRVATLAMFWWSVFTAITGLAASLPQILITRLVFGLGEGVFPACAFKTIAVWFPKKERATANALMLASNPLGIALCPLAVVTIMSFWGWRAVFFSLSLPGILTASLFWLFIQNKPADSARVSAQELAEIEWDGTAPSETGDKVTALKILMDWSILCYFLVYMTYGIAIWGFTAWLPSYLVKVRGFSMVQMGVFASLPFFAGTVGGVLSGWLSDRYFKENRRLPIVIAELASALFLYLTFSSESALSSVICQTLAGFFLIAVLSFFWALPMNTISKKRMGVASGFINMAGQIAGFASPLLLGYFVDVTGGRYDLAFMVIVASLLVSAATVLTLPSRRVEQPLVTTH